MSVANDLPSIESRIVTMVRDYCTIPSIDHLSTHLRSVLDVVANQAVASSEGGKRLRALLALTMYDCMSANGTTSVNCDRRSAMMDLACAIEVFQTAALVHDDIIDDSDLRRGHPSAHRALTSAMHSNAEGAGLGIMLGDLLATASIAIAGNAAQQLPHTAQINQVFTTTQHDVEIGQILDVATETIPLTDPEALAHASLEVFRWKTASYTTIAPIQLGLLACDIDPHRAREYALAIGQPLGIAFQLADDLLDVIGSSAATGKPIGGDIREGKRTVLLADLLARANNEQRRTIVRIFTADHRTDEDVHTIIDLYRESWAIDASIARIRTLWNDSVAAMTTLGLDDANLHRLRTVCSRFVPKVLVTAES